MTQVYLMDKTNPLTVGEIRVLSQTQDRVSHVTDGQTDKLIVHVIAPSRNTFRTHLKTELFQRSFKV